MSPTERFMEYALEFEKTYVDDDWTRLERFFAPDAVYEVRGVSFGCRLVGPEAIFRGIKTCLDGFDRRMAGREIAVVEPPRVDGDRVTVGMTVTYRRPGAPDFVLRGRVSARHRDGRIVELVDEYGPEVDPAIHAWMRDHAPDAVATYG
jgi:hypothetical protein